MKSHRLCWLLLLSLVLVAPAFAGGTFQLTDDRKKTLVWNNDPQPGDIANWSGGRDENGYASGAGTLKWSRPARGFTTGSNISSSRKTTPISSYSGTMEHGKFSGEVTTVDHGKSYHAKFVDGQRKGLWQRGTNVAKSETAEPAETSKKSERAEPEKSTTTASTVADSENVEAAKSKVSATEEADVPAAGPENEGNAPATEKPAKDSQPLIAQASSEQPDESPQHTPVTRKAALAPGAVRAFDRPTSAAAKKSEAVTIKKAEKVKAEKPATPEKSVSLEPAELQTDVSPQSPAEGPLQKREKTEPPKLKSEPAVTEKAPASAKETPPDDSIQSLIGPPSSLRMKAAAARATPPPAAAVVPASPPPSTPAEVSTPATPKLTAVEAMDIADIEARTRGYDLGDYQLPKAQYNSSSDTWSVAYVARGSGESKKFNVSVQDKSGKAEVKK